MHSPPLHVTTSVTTCLPCLGHRCKTKPFGFKGKLQHQKPWGSHSLQIVRRLLYSRPGWRHFWMILQLDFSLTTMYVLYFLPSCRCWLLSVYAPAQAILWQLDLHAYKYIIYCIVFPFTMPCCTWLKRCNRQNDPCVKMRTQETMRSMASDPFGEAPSRHSWVQTEGQDLEALATKLKWYIVSTALE